MRRLTAIASLTALGVLVSTLLAAPAAQAAPDLRGTTVQRDLFGMHVFNVQNGQWPTVPIGSLRLWDNETTWAQIEPAQDQFNWAKLDAAVANAEKNGVTDILMVLAGTPAWASDDPASGGAAGVLPGAAGMPKDLHDWNDWVRRGRHALQGPDHRVPAVERGQPRHLLHRQRRQRWPS